MDSAQHQINMDYMVETGIDKAVRNVGIRLKCMEMVLEHMEVSGRIEREDIAESIYEWAIKRERVSDK